MNKLIDVILTDYTWNIQDIQKNLESEESGKTIARLQGRLRGSKLFISILKQHMTSFTFSRVSQLDEDSKIIKIEDLDDSTLRELFSQVEESKNHIGWKGMKDAILSELEKQKNYLFYDAEKGRDLDLIHGFRDAITEYSEICGRIENEHKRRRKNEPLTFAIGDYDE